MPSEEPCVFWQLHCGTNLGFGITEAFVLYMLAEQVLFCNPALSDGLLEQTPFEFKQILGDNAANKMQEKYNDVKSARNWYKLFPTKPTL